MGEITRFPINRRKWVEYQQALVEAAKSLNKAQECHRALFLEESQQLLDAGIRISVEFEKAQVPRDCDGFL